MCKEPNELRSRRKVDNGNKSINGRDTEIIKHRL